MPRCIYCQQERPPEFYEKVEHVLPQSFGRFLNNLTLRDIVCDLCKGNEGPMMKFETVCASVMLCFPCVMSCRHPLVSGASISEVRIRNELAYDLPVLTHFPCTNDCVGRDLLV
jgi:hypothetical protein